MVERTRNGVSRTYYHIKGKVITDACEDYKEYCLDDYEGGIDELNKEYGTNFTEDMVYSDGYIIIGGFDDHGSNILNNGSIISVLNAQKGEIDI